jgi:hypothetical protein
VAPHVTKKWLNHRHGPRTEGKSEQTRPNEDPEHRGCCIIIQAYLGLNLVATQTTSCNFTCSHWSQHMPCVIDAMALSTAVHQGARAKSSFQNLQTETGKLLPLSEYCIELSCTWKHTFSRRCASAELPQHFNESGTDGSGLLVLLQRQYI